MSFSGQLLDIVFGGAGFASLAFSESGGPALAVGEKTEISFTSVRLNKPLVVSARVRHRADRDDFRHYGFQFIERQQLESRLSPELFRLFNRRASYRVKPSPGSPVQVTLQGPAGVQATGELVDISAAGMGLRVPLEVEATLTATTHIIVSFSLPDCPHPLSLEAIIRDRHLAGVEIHYGIEFDLEQSKQAKRQEDAIMNFVMKRQREALS